MMNWMLEVEGGACPVDDMEKVDGFTFLFQSRRGWSCERENKGKLGIERYRRRLAENGGTGPHTHGPRRSNWLGDLGDLS